MTTILAHAADPEIRRMASSGGLIKALLVHLLESGQVDGLVIARTGDGQRFAPGFVATDRVEDLLTPLTNSVYYPVDPQTTLLQLDPEKRYAATLLPCDVARLRVAQRAGRLGNVTFVASLLCNCTPAAAWTTEIFARLGVDRAAVQRLSYRGDGWPGLCTIEGDGFRHQLAAAELWASGAASHIRTRCRACPCDGLASCDLMAGDPWGARAPIVDGRTLARVLTPRARSAIAAAEAAGRIVTEPAADDLFDSQVTSLVTVKAQRRKQL